MSSISAIRAALETALASMTPPLATAYENAAFTPVQATPYQRVNLLLAEPDNSEIGPHALERGIFQVTLCYPVGAGPAGAQGRAELLRTTFARATSFAASGIAVRITRTPEIAPAQIDGDRYELPVRIRFEAEIPA